ncbi:hypothetical protein FQN52_001075 [Onygenales sp. PD_12]|nr:hypothetical protein FQN53_002033 [Emmonsiellopsis sp. PD_33]KAK2782141.1 hypothetical protein FQN52_001075 [Onygenales sp. PD_12]KAK2800377.1 hypothetical protein FQN51_006103 [Onygenales sp. PD_10]
MTRMTDAGKGNWVRSPPASPYTIPIMARSDASPSTGTPVHRRKGPYAQVKTKPDQGSPKARAKATQEHSPAFVDKDGEIKSENSPSPATTGYRLTPQADVQSRQPRYYPVPLIPPRTFLPRASAARCSRGYQTTYPSGPDASFVPRVPPFPTKVVFGYPPAQQNEFEGGQNSLLNNNLRGVPLLGPDPMAQFMAPQENMPLPFIGMYQVQSNASPQEAAQFSGTTQAHSGVNQIGVGQPRSVGATAQQQTCSQVFGTPGPFSPQLSLGPQTHLHPNYNNNTIHPTQHQHSCHLYCSTTPPAGGATGIPIMAPGITSPLAGYQAGHSTDPVCYPHAMPFDDGARYSLPPKWGVIKITNIPYSVTRNEVLQFLGRNAKPLSPETGCPVHIIMERSTGKTMDCYVEFPNEAEAESALEWVNRCLGTFRTPKLGNRHVTVEASNQDELLRDLFPRAKNVTWKDGIPQVRHEKDEYCSGFQGFFTAEEIYCTIRHAEVPHRSPFCNKCLQRPYENMISTLYKFPWYASMHYTVEDRNLLFSATLRLMHALIPQVERGKTIGLDSRLVTDLLDAGSRCPAFNERQKFTLSAAAKNHASLLNTPPSSRFWPFDTLSRKQSASEEHVMQYANLIATGAANMDCGTDVLNNSWHPTLHGASPFGRIWLEWGWGNTEHSWQSAVNYETNVLVTMVTEGVRVRRAIEAPKPKPCTPSPKPPAFNSKEVPTTNTISRPTSRSNLRYPVHATHKLNRHASSDPNFSMDGQGCADVFTNGNHYGGVRVPHPTHRMPSNSFSGGIETGTAVNARNNIFGPVGTRRRRAATSASCHPPVLEVDEDLIGETFA